MAAARVVGLAIAATLVVVVVSLPSQNAGAQPASERLLDPSKPITYFVADGTGRAGYRVGDRELARWALDAWRRESGGALRFVESPEASSLVRVYWADPQEGQYGEMRSLVVDGRRGAAVYIRPDTRALGPDIAVRTESDGLFRETIVYLTCLHELGHALGLAHTADYRDIMYFFGFGGDIVEYFDRYRRQLTARADMARVHALSAADIGRVRGLYGGR